MARSNSSAGTPATVALTRAGVAFTVHTYNHSLSIHNYGLEAAAALQLDPATVFKTLLVSIDTNLVVAVVPVSGQLDLKAMAAAAGGKRAELAAPAIAERATGYVVGGISPFGQRKALPTLVDVSALGLPTMYVSGGKRGMDLGVAPTELVRLLGATVAAIGRA